MIGPGTEGCAGHARITEELRAMVELLANRLIGEIEGGKALARQIEHRMYPPSLSTVAGHPSFVSVVLVMASWNLI